MAARFTRRAIKQYTDEDQLKLLRSLKAGDCCLVTKVSLMRGYDYKCPQSGIALFVGKMFAHRREVSQALGRVGRYSEPCRRFYLESLPSKELYDITAA